MEDDKQVWFSGEMLAAAREKFECDQKEGIHPGGNVDFDELLMSAAGLWMSLAKKYGMTVGELCQVYHRYVHDLFCTDAKPRKAVGSSHIVGLSDGLLSGMEPWIRLVVGAAQEHGLTVERVKINHRNFAARQDVAAYQKKVLLVNGRLCCLSRASSFSGLFSQVSTARAVAGYSMIIRQELSDVRRTFVIPYEIVQERRKRGKKLWMSLPATKIDPEGLLSYVDAWHLLK